MTPYYENRFGKLYQGDCLEVMKELDMKFDLVLTDPPYGMRFRSNRRKVKHDKISNDSSLEWVDSFTDSLFEVCKEDSAQYIFCSFHNLDIFKQSLQNRFKVKNILVWEKNNHSAGDLTGDFAPKVEFVLFSHKGRKKCKGKETLTYLNLTRQRMNYILRKNQ